MKFCLAIATLAAADTELAPYPGYTGPLKVTGKVGGYLYGSNAYVWYRIWHGLEADCATPPAGVENACGIHIHEGKTCDDADAVGGHYYNKDTVTSDPWTPVTYMAKADGSSKGKSFAGIGAGQDINGRAIVVHDKTGARVACALIEGKLEQKAADTNLAPYPGYSGPLTVTGNVGAYLYGENAYVWYKLGGLEAECAEAPAGVANACGIHIHEGMTCEDADAVGGHYYDHDSIESDPWSPVTYIASPSGSSKGKTFAGIGAGQDINGRAIVVHDKTGARVACALIEGKIADTNLAPYPGYSGPLTVTGSVGGFLSGQDAYVWYSLSGLEADCATTPEGVANACGIHIHEGKTCDDADAIGGHYYDKDSLDSDPWSPVTYIASADGKSKGKTFAGIGAGQDINGRAIVVHDKTGARVACALIEGKLDVLV